MQSEPQHQISKRALTVWRITALILVIFFTLLLIGYLIIAYIFNLPLWISVILIAVVLLMAIFMIGVFPLIKWKKWRYEVHEHEIDLQYGIFIIRRILIPMVRVQHVDTVQGPLLRKYKLASVTISTAATTHEIPALDVEEAEQLRTTISQLARVVEEDV